jgi:hypothetical protein
MSELLPVVVSFRDEGKPGSLGGKAPGGTPQWAVVAADAAQRQRPKGAARTVVIITNGPCPPAGRRPGIPRLANGTN